LNLITAPGQDRLSCNSWVNNRLLFFEKRNSIINIEKVDSFISGASTGMLAGDITRDDEV